MALKRNIPFYFLFSCGNILKRDITRRDTVGDLRNILGVPEDTVITFLYKHNFLDPDDEGTKTTLLHKILDFFKKGDRDPNYMSGWGGGVETASFIIVGGAHRPGFFKTTTGEFGIPAGETIEYKNIKYDINGNESKYMHFPMYPEQNKDLRDTTEIFTLDDYSRQREIYMRRFHDYDITSHGSIKNSFFFVPENMTVIFNTELGVSLSTLTRDSNWSGLSDSVRTQRRLNELSYSEQSPRETIERIYGPGSIIPEHELQFRGWWDPMGSGLIPKEVFEIVDSFIDRHDLTIKLQDYNSKYDKWHPLGRTESGLYKVEQAIKELAQYDIDEIPYLNAQMVRFQGQREGTLWFNIYPVRSSVRPQDLSKILKWLSQKVGDTNITVNCSICRNLNSQSEFEDELKKCLDYDGEIFIDTFLEKLSGGSDIIELSRQGSFSSLKITKKKILSELERYETIFTSGKTPIPLSAAYLNLVRVMGASADNISIEDLCHILVFMKLMRGMHRHELLEPEPGQGGAKQGGAKQGGAKRGGDMRRKTKRKTKRKKSKRKTKRKSKRKSKRGYGTKR